ncbi:MAG TPA: hypothetical protein VL382_09795 [Terriglobales bacterium]|nr:hypothetical protein [Terriglobales bacterium]
MKRFVIAFAITALVSLPLMAQHGGGHAGGMGMGNSMAGSHGNSGMSDTHGNSGNSAKPSTAGAKTPGELLTQNTKLASKLQALLPAGTDLQTAASGFKNLGQFVAAVHVAHNLGISFDDLKTKMTGDHTESLGKAIHQLKPAANSTTEASKANKQAKQDIQDTQGS